MHESKYKVFIDGQEGTTGLEIRQHLMKRNDVEILKIDVDNKKDNNERGKLINAADIVFLCLPDDAARESAALVTNTATCVIDASTAHRTLDEWAYGIPELSAYHRNKIKNSKRVSVPGCFATGFNILLYPVVNQGLITPDYPVTCHSVTGYSGGGKKLINIFESENNKFKSPCFYSLDLHHKHIPEMQKHSGLTHAPIFTPIVSNYYRGMIVAIPLYVKMMNKKTNAYEMRDFYSEYYNNQTFIKVLPFNAHKQMDLGYLDAESCINTNNMEIMTFGDDEQILLIVRFDNLGKGASGAAIQNMNIVLGKEESYSLI